MIQDKYLFRPTTAPTTRQRTRISVAGRRQQQTKQNSMVGRPQQNFFKKIFVRNNYLWIFVYQASKPFSIQQKMSYDNMCNQIKLMYLSFGLKEQSLPICSERQEYNYWFQKYQCVVILDQSAVIFFDDILSQDNCTSVKAVVRTSKQAIIKLRSSKFKSKITGIYDDINVILQEMKESLQKLKLLQKDDHVEISKKRLPNFMRLRIKDKAELITYRNHLYFMMNLHNNKVDMNTSKNRFIEQCQMMYTSEKDKQFMKYYLSYPFSHKEILKFYTEDSFFFKCLNNTLRVAKSTEEFFIIGHPFNKLFHAIQNTYKEQNQLSLSKSQKLKFYRGADLAQSQVEYLQSCIGSYIQMHGFISTTIDEEVARKFAKDRKHNKIIQIIIDQGYGDADRDENDYGFVDLSSLSRFEDEQQFLFNALNIFKVIGRQTRGDYQYFTLKYGTIFNILRQDNVQLLEQNDRMAYHTYKELIGQKDNNEDLGRVFLKSHETQKSVDYYEMKIEEARHQKRPQQEITSLIIKRSEALILNGQPSKALEGIMLLKFERQRLKKSKKIGSNQLLQDILSSNTSEILTDIDISKKYSVAAHSLDKFQQTQRQVAEVNSSILGILLNDFLWSFDVAFGQVELKMQLAHVKQSMQNYSEMYKILREAEGLIDDIQKMSLKKEISFQNLKKLYLQKTYVFELMAKISQFLEGSSFSFELLQSKFSQTELKLTNLIEKGSYDVNLLQIRKIQVQRRRSNFKELKQQHISNVSLSIISIKATSLRDSNVSEGYHLLSSIEQQSNSMISYSKAVEYLQKQNMEKTQCYNENDPRSMQTMIDIAKCYRKLKCSEESLCIMKEEIKIVPFKTKPNHTIVTKILYTMGVAYLDLGQYSLSLKCFEKGLNMLKQILTKTQLENYHHRFKIEMQMGRVFTCLALLPEAQERLNRYHNFIMKLYKGQHSDIANSFNYYGILNMKFKKFDEALERFVQSEKMFIKTSGSTSLLLAKIQCNLALVYCYISKPNKRLALESIDKAAYLLNTIYFQNKYEKEIQIHTETYMICYYYAEIYKRFRQYSKAKASYEESLASLKELKYKVYLQRQVKQSHNSSFNLKSVGVQPKKENHELYCRVRIIECKYKLKDYTFFQELNLVIQELQKEIYQLSDDGVNTLQSQLRSLLIFCKNLKKYYQNKINSVVNSRQIEGNQSRLPISELGPNQGVSEIKNQSNIQLNFTNRMGQIKNIF